MHLCTNLISSASDENDHKVTFVRRLYGYIIYVVFVFKLSRH